MKPKRHRWKYDPSAGVYTCVFDATPLRRTRRDDLVECSGCGAKLTDQEIANRPGMWTVGLDQLHADKPLSAFVDMINEAKGEEDGRENHAED